MRLITLSDIKLPLGKHEDELLKIAQKKLGAKVKYFSIKKKSLDARDKNNIRYVYTIECSSENLNVEKRVFPQIPKEKLPEKPVVIVGSGPAGLFCAVRCIEYGVKTIVLERGASVEEREKDIHSFFTTKQLNVNSNVQFGEGGAGTFSDGKLNTQTHSSLNKEVLELFVRFGAPEEIKWLQKPHIGSDNLKKVVKNIREYIISNGGAVRFHARLEDINVENGVLSSVVVQSDKGLETLPVSSLVLAVGHSARDTFSMLEKRGVPMRQKDFAVGVRIEHLQSSISFAQYGKAYPLLPAADYKLVSHTQERAAFTFCMCPGGYVMPATSENGCVVTNGMSNYARDAQNANSALIAQVGRADFSDDSPLAGVRFQQALERKAFEMGGKDYKAPVQLVADFLKDKTGAHFGEVQPTYAAGTQFCDLRSVLPKAVAQTLKSAILDMDKRLKGFASPDAILTAVETRTSSPIRIERNENLESVGVVGLYPCGEGAGYAGGITSSAADGLRVAQAIIDKLSK